MINLERFLGLPPKIVARDDLAAGPDRSVRVAVDGRE